MTDPEQQVTRVFAIRHGETDWNVQSRIQGQIDIGLNDRGRWQVHRAAQALGGEGLAAVYSSDLSRASETAAAIAAQAGRTVVELASLRERAFGSFEGMSFDEIRVKWPDMSERWRRRDPEFGAPGGETLANFYRRCVDAASVLAAAHPGEAIAVVAHGGVIDCLYRAATGVELQAPRSWRLGNASINRLLYTGQRFTVLAWDDTSHLESDPTCSSGINLLNEGPRP